MDGWVDGREGGRAKDLVVANFRDISFLPSSFPSLPPSIVVPSSRSFSFGCDVSERRLPDGGGGDSHHNAEVKLALSLFHCSLPPLHLFPPSFSLFLRFPPHRGGQRTDLFKRGGGGSWSYLPFAPPCHPLPRSTRPPQPLPPSAPSLTSAKMVMKMRKTAANGMAMGGTGNGEEGGREGTTDPAAAECDVLVTGS